MRHLASMCAVLTFSTCAPTAVCGDEDLECWLNHFEVELDGQRLELDLVSNDQLPAPSGVPVEVNRLVLVPAGPQGLARTLDGVTELLDAGTGYEAIWSSSGADLWAVGGAQRLHFDGSTWASTGPQPAALHAVWGSGPNDVWFVGDQGLVLHFDGTGTQVVDSGTTTRLRSVSGNASGQVWISGSDFVAQREGSGFTRRALPSGTSLVNALWVAPSGRVAVATNRGVLVWTGSAFTEIPSQATFSSVTGTGDTAFAAGSSQVFVTVDLVGLTQSSRAIPIEARGLWTNGDVLWLLGFNGELFTATLPGPPGASSIPPLDGTWLSLTAFPAPRPPSSGALLAPTVMQVPASLVFDPAAGEFTDFPVGWADPNGCQPMICFSKCSPTGRCFASSRCSRGKNDFRIRGFNAFAARFAAKPKQTIGGKCVVRAAVVEGCAPRLTPGARVAASAPIEVDCQLLGPPAPPTGGGPGGGGGGTSSCGTCVEGGTCPACTGGSTACGGKNCCLPSETCRNGSCYVSPTAARLGFTVEECGATPRYTVRCNNGGCCPSCMTCDSNGTTCSLP